MMPEKEPDNTNVRAWLVLTTLDDPAEAENLAGELVQRGLAACVHILPAGRSIYVWKGNIETDSEVTLLIKTSVDARDDLQAHLTEHHPYETPEIIAVPITHGSPDYLNWITQCTS
ncbi:divalent-cation tolerance protein CutA [Thioalkalivibrio sp. K90mix]|jgi:periplasmic divalent cation tolerance protein|uniref:divalent-cation tolerance protein CutA n=1 Tax=Thioalkalivibrio sp. (strain K90mix) TaxID=396595 RepID=UPI0002D99A98|nr:divalent-cation tolerance protein CutA [Thioalkalivibrio sp. K90mix]